MRRNQLLFSLLLPALLLGMGRGFTIPVLPIIAKEEFGAGVALATFVVIAPMVGSVIATVPTGYLIDRVGRRKILIASPLVTALSSFLVFRATSYSEFLGYMTIAGIAQQMWQMSRLAVIADTGPQNQRGRQITSMSGVQRAGTLAGPFVGGIVGELFGLRVPFILFGLAALVATVPTYLLIKETSPTVLARRRGSTAKAEVDTSWSKLLTRPVLVLFASQFFANTARGGAQGNGGPYFIFAVFAYGVGPATLGSISLVAGVVGIPIMFASGQIMDRRGRKWTIVPAAILLGSGLLVMIVTAGLELPFMLFAGTFVWINMAISMMAGSMQTLGSDIAPAEARGKFFGVNRLIAEGGSLANPASFSLVTALVTGAAGFAAAFSIMAGGAFISASLVGFLVKETLHKEIATRP
jgi:MFS family permease